MPIYEFHCESCGNAFEQIRTFSDTSMPTCPRCESVQVNRQMSRPAIHFKGSGWYITDSKKSSKSSANGVNGGSEEKSESTTAEKSTESGESAAEPAAGESKSEKSSSESASSAESSTPTKSE